MFLVQTNCLLLCRQFQPAHRTLDVEQSMMSRGSGKARAVEQHMFLKCLFCISLALVLTVQSGNRAFGLDATSTRLVSESGVSPDDLPRLLAHIMTDIDRSYLGYEYVSKWVKPISVVLYGDNTSHAEESVQDLVNEISLALPVSIDLVIATPGQLNELYLKNPNRVYLLYANLQDYPTQLLKSDGTPTDTSDRLLPFDLEGRRDTHLHEALAAYQYAVGPTIPMNCEHWIFRDYGEILYSFGFLDAEQDANTQNRCLTIMLLHSLGLRGLVTETDQSFLSDSEAIRSITALDLLALRSLYDPRVAPFTGKDELTLDLDALLP